jgi:aspartyl/asparaginyl beta-hydroxylase (cupin superfamily)
MATMRMKGGNLIGRLLRLNETLISKYDPRANKTFLDTANFPWVPHLEAQWQEIRRELDVLLQYRPFVPPLQKVSPVLERFTPDDGWKTYFFNFYGWNILPSSVQCPHTAQALRAIPGMLFAMFSLLEPGKRIPAHRGLHKGILRYHLGIKIPSTDVGVCGIRVGNDRRGWVDGKSFIFDDTHEHEVWNDTGEVRVILFVDIPRPLPLWLSSANWMMAKGAKYLSPDIREARDNAIRYAHKIPYPKPPVIHGLRQRGQPSPRDG